MSGRRRVGIVTDYDSAVGLGTVRSDRGERYQFHCTAIADGTREIVPGTPVRFALQPRLGVWEATEITPS